MQEKCNYRFNGSITYIMRRPVYDRPALLLLLGPSSFGSIKHVSQIQFDFKWMERARGCNAEIDLLVVWLPIPPTWP